MAENTNFLIAQELTPNEADSPAIRNSRGSLEQQVAIARIKERLPMNAELSSFLLKEQDFIKSEVARTANIPVATVKTDEVYYLPQPEEGTLGSSNVGFVTLPSLPIENKDLKNYMEAVIGGHEIYHSTGVKKIGYVGIGKTVTDRHGLAYGETRNSLLEESLALRSQLKTESRARQAFPSGAEKFAKIEELVVRANALDQKSQKLIILSEIEDGDVRFITQGKDALKLIDLLEQEIGGFSTLCERARVNHETIKLAKTVDKRFGRGTYKRLVTSDLDDAGMILKDLQKA